MRLLGQCQVSFQSARISCEDLFWWSISPWSGASWKIVEWNVPPALGFGNSERFCLEIGRCLRWASEWADSASHCSLHLDWGRRLEPPLLVRVERGERALVLAVCSVTHALVIQQPRSQLHGTLQSSAFSGPCLTSTGNRSQDSVYPSYYFICGGFGGKLPFLL